MDRTKRRRLFRRRLLLLLGNDARTYSGKVLSYNPIAYWPLWETSGTTAVCLTNSAMNGTYARDVSTMGTQAGIGDGFTAPTFDGTNDIVDVFSATLAAAVNMNAGTAICWAKVAAAGNWTDGTVDHIWRLQDTTNAYWIWFRKNSVNNQWHCQRKDAGGLYTQTPASGAPTAWVCAAMTWSEALNQCKWYINASQVGSTTVCGNWNGNVVHKAIIGAGNNGPITEAWKGGLARMALWNSVLSTAILTELSKV